MMNSGSLDRVKVEGGNIKVGQFEARRVYRHPDGWRGPPEWDGVDVLDQTDIRYPLSERLTMIESVQVDTLDQFRKIAFVLVLDLGKATEKQVAKVDTDYGHLHYHPPGGQGIVELRRLETVHDYTAAANEAREFAHDKFQHIIDEGKWGR